MAQSLTRVHFQVFLILLLCFAAAGYAGYLAMRDMQLSSYQERASQTARAASDRITELLTQQQQRLENTTGHPGVLPGLEDVIPAERDIKEEEFKSMLP